MGSGTCVEEAHKPMRLMILDETPSTATRSFPRMVRMVGESVVSGGAWTKTQDSMAAPL